MTSCIYITHLAVGDTHILDDVLSTIWAAGWQHIRLNTRLQANYHYRIASFNSHQGFFERRVVRSTSIGGNRKIACGRKFEVPCYLQPSIVKAPKLVTVDSSPSVSSCIQPRSQVRLRVDRNRADTCFAAAGLGPSGTDAYDRSPVS